MRWIIPCVVAASVLAVDLASAQTSPPFVEAPFLPIAPADMGNYCVYESRVYSIGSGLCFGRIGYVCLPSTGPATGNRAYWTNKEDQVFARPACN